MTRRPALRPVLRRRLVIGVLAGTLAAVTVLAAGIGAVPIPASHVVGILIDRLGGSTGIPFTDQEAAILLHLRLPRVVLGVLVGAALAVCGALLQGLFRNPLADPGLIGVSSGSALAAAAWIVFGASAAPLWAGVGLPLAAFAGGLGATIVVYRIGRHAGRTLVATMLLAGVAVAALCGALLGLLFFLADDAALRAITFWSLGSLGGATWPSVLWSAPLLLAPVLASPRLARGLNALLLGEAAAFHLGVRVERLKRWTIGLSALGVGAAVAASGMIGFVGLVVPHLVRLALGPDHRTLLPASALLGALLLVVADLVARTIVAPAELPIGIVTALAGGPFFLWLLLRERPA
ncbi:MAG: iron ABC transporter permease [Rhodothermales bacterium]|nr:iron ABC transporter permease [Rhodothermales bacterium]MCA0268677.1 iron ABC transporter permease [Bacteroidota bacterium]